MNTGDTAFVLVSSALVMLMTPGLVWLNREEILYATDDGINGRGERNFDLWVRHLQASTPSQKTYDGSFDSWPAVGNEGREVFFFSNRGAGRPLQDRLQIYRLDLKTMVPDTVPLAADNR